MKRAVVQIRLHPARGYLEGRKGVGLYGFDARCVYSGNPTTLKMHEEELTTAKMCRIQRAQRQIYEPEKYGERGQLPVRSSRMVLWKSK